MSEHTRYLSSNLLDTVSSPFALSVTGRLSKEVKVKAKTSVYKRLDSPVRRSVPSSAACLCSPPTAMASCFDFPAVLHSLLQAKLKINCECFQFLSDISHLGTVSRLLFSSSNSMWLSPPTVPQLKSKTIFPLNSHIKAQL